MNRAGIIDAYFKSGSPYPWIPYRPIGETVVREVERMGPDGLFLSTAAALIEKESGGRPIFGCDHGPDWTFVPPFCQVEVTAERVKALIRNYNEGGGLNGISYCQLTSIGLVKEAERIGGAHLPWANMRVGFAYLNDLIRDLGWPAGAAGYNAGPSNWRMVMNTYGADMARLEREWAARLSQAEPDEEEEPAVSTPTDTLADQVEAAIAFGTKMIGTPYGTGWTANTWPALSPLYAGISRHDTPAWYAGRPVICSGLINVLRYEIAGLPAVGKKQGDAWPGGTGAIGRHLAHAPGSTNYQPVKNTARGWLVFSPYLGERLALQGHVGVTLGNGYVLEARVPTLTKNRTEEAGSRALVAGGGKPYLRAIPPSLWLRK